VYAIKESRGRGLQKRQLPLFRGGGIGGEKEKILFGTKRKGLEFAARGGGRENPIPTLFKLQISPSKGGIRAVCGIDISKIYF